MAYEFNTTKILIVDDVVPMHTLLRSILGIFGFKHIEVAENGEDGFNKFCKFNPDLVLTDWMMEPMNGMELIEKIRKDPLSPNRFVPILLMTGFSSRLRVEHARDVGITEFVAKPFTAQELYNRIERIIEKPRQFVDSVEFFGPDRRRKMRHEYDGAHRRSTDNPDQKNTQSKKERQEEADIIDKITKTIKGGES